MVIVPGTVAYRVIINRILSFKYRQLLLSRRRQWIWFIVCLLGVLLWLLLDGILEIIHCVQIRLKQDDVAFRDVVGPQDPQTGCQNGPDLGNRPEDRLQRGEKCDEEDPDDEIAEDGKCDAPGDVVRLTHRLDHEGAEQTDQGQAAVVAVHEGEGDPGPRVTHQQHLRGQGHVVGRGIVGSQAKVEEAKQALGEEAQGDEEPGPALGHPAQEGGGTAREFRHQRDLQGLDEEGGEATIEAEGVDHLLDRAKLVTGLPYVEAAAERQQQEREQGKEAPFAPRNLHEGGVEVLVEERCCPAAQGGGQGHQQQQRDCQRLVPEQVPVAAVVAACAAGGRPLVLRAAGAAGAVCGGAARTPSPPCPKGSADFSTRFPFPKKNHRNIPEFHHTPLSYSSR